MNPTLGNLWKFGRRKPSSRSPAKNKYLIYTLLPAEKFLICNPENAYHIIQLWAIEVHFPNRSRSLYWFCPCSISPGLQDVLRAMETWLYQEVPGIPKADVIYMMSISHINWCTSHVIAILFFLIFWAMAVGWKLHCRFITQAAMFPRIYLHKVICTTEAPLALQSSVRWTGVFALYHTWPWFSIPCCLKKRSRAWFSCEA